LPQSEQEKQKGRLRDGRPDLVTAYEAEREQMERMRKALVAIKAFEQPLTNTVTINDDHTVKKPVYFWQVKGGKFTLIGSQKD